jgi:hypothetical protein
MLAEARAREKRCVASMTQSEEHTVANGTQSRRHQRGQIFKSLIHNNLVGRTPERFLAQCLLGLWPAFILEGFPEDS